MFIIITIISLNEKYSNIERGGLGIGREQRKAAGG